jgi:hypothetical protein
MHADIAPEPPATNGGYPHNRTKALPDLRHLAYADARRFTLIMLKAMEAEIHAAKYTLRQPHDAQTPRAQVKVTNLNDHVMLLTTMLACGRGRVASQFITTWPGHSMPWSPVGISATRTGPTYGPLSPREVLGAQADWVEHQGRHHDYDMHGRQARFRFWFDYQHRPAVQEALAACLWPYGPTYWAEAWLGLVSPIKDLAAREAAWRLGDQRLNRDGYPVYHPW